MNSRFKLNISHFSFKLNISCFKCFFILKYNVSLFQIPKEINYRFTILQLNPMAVKSVRDNTCI